MEFEISRLDHHGVVAGRGQAFDYLIRNESSFFAPFSFNQMPDPLLWHSALPGCDHRPIACVARL